MPDERTYNVISDDKCLFESMTKEQILAAIVQAVETHQITDVDTGFVQTIKEQNHGTGLKFWIGSTAEYNALQSIEQDVFYILTDDTELEDMEADIASFRETLSALGTVVSDLSQSVSDLTETASASAANLNEKDQKNGFVLFEGELPNGAYLTPEYLNELTLPDKTVNITDYTIVKVYAGVAGSALGYPTLCTVDRPLGSSSDAWYIQGVGCSSAGCHPVEGYTLKDGGVTFHAINIGFKKQENDHYGVLLQSSTRFGFSRQTFNSAQQEGHGFEQLTVTKIVGVM